MIQQWLLLCNYCFSIRNIVAVLTATKKKKLTGITLIMSPLGQFHLIYSTFTSENYILQYILHCAQN